MQTFTAAPHHDVLALLVQLAVLLLSARVLAEVAQRFGQPAVVGEILAGILLGPSLLSGLVPSIGEWLVPHTATQGHLLETVSLLGALLLLLITGMETDLALIRRHARTAMGASLGGIAVPFATGFWLGQSLPDALLGNPDRRLVFSLFIATAMSISAIPVIAKVLMDMKLMRRDVGQSILAAGMTDDAIGWMLLSVVLGLAGGSAIEAGSVLWAVGKVVGFLAFSFVVGRWIVGRALDWVQDRSRIPEALLTLVIVFTFAWGAITQALGLEAVFGAFVVGILFGHMPRLPGSVRHGLERITLGIFAPIFFAVAGLKVDVRQLLEPRLFGIALLVIAVASLGKIVGGYVGARWIGGSDRWTALAFGAGMNARGAMEIIIATIGLSMGILSSPMFSIIVLMAITTSLMAPPSLRWVLARVRPGEEEMRRLRQEELAETSLIAGFRRVLLPVRFRPGERRSVLTLEAALLERLASRNAIAATLFSVADARERVPAAEFLDRIADLLPHAEISRKVVNGGSPIDSILDEADKDYDLVVLGAPEQGGAGDVFNPMADALIRCSPCPTMVVKGRLSEYNWPPQRILVPTNGSLASRNAADVAFALAASDDPDGSPEVIVLNVVAETASRSRLDAGGEAFRKQLEAARGIVDELRAVGEAHGVRTRGEVRTGVDPEAVILDFVADENTDLLVLGTDLRAGSSRLFLGPRVEQILKNAPAPVVVINTS